MTGLETAYQWLYQHAPEAVREWLDTRERQREADAEWESAFGPDAMAKRAIEDAAAVKAPWLDRLDGALLAAENWLLAEPVVTPEPVYDIARPVTLATPMTQIPANPSIAHNSHLQESSQPTAEQTAASDSWHRDFGESYMQKMAMEATERQFNWPGSSESSVANTAEAAYHREAMYHAWEDLDADMDRKQQAAQIAAEAQPKGQPDFFDKSVMTYPPERISPSGYNPTKSQEYIDHEKFFGKYSPTRSQEQRDAGRVATAEKQNAQSGLFGTIERQQEKGLEA